MQIEFEWLNSRDFFASLATAQPLPNTISRAQAMKFTTMKPAVGIALYSMLVKTISKSAIGDIHLCVLKVHDGHREVRVGLDDQPPNARGDPRLN